MNKLSVMLAGLALTIGGAAQAGILYDQDLVNPAASGPNPNFYNGSGNPNGGFTVNNIGGIELGLRAKGRQQPGVIDNPTGNLYNVLAGPQTSPPAPTRAWWNWEFSIDLQPGGTGSLVLNDILPFSYVMIQDLTKGTSGIGQLSTTWLDDSTWGPAGEGNLGPATLLTDWGLQNSENMTFADNPLVGFNMNDNDYYRFTLVVGTAAGVIGSDVIDVAVGDAVAPAGVPEPATIALFGAGLAGLGAARRRRKARKN